MDLISWLEYQGGSGLGYSDTGRLVCREAISPAFVASSASREFRFRVLWSYQMQAFTIWMAGEHAVVVEV
jgi:hypothetical protein